LDTVVSVLRKCGFAAKAGTAARAATMRDNTAIIPILLNIKVFLLFFGRPLLFSNRTGAFYPGVVGQ
jgi:hypothetical protein